MIYSSSCPSLMVCFSFPSSFLSSLSFLHKCLSPPSPSLPSSSFLHPHSHSCRKWSIITLFLRTPITILVFSPALPAPPWLIVTFMFYLSISTKIDCIQILGSNSTM